MAETIYRVNSFAEKKYLGNPAVVVVLNAPRSEDWMKAVAREVNLSETAFVTSHPLGFNLRWFTPVTEIELCGHATLASAHILWEKGFVDPQKKILFFTKSGRLSAENEQELIILDFPAAPLIPGDVSEEIIRAVGAVPDFVGISGEKWLFEYADEAIVKGLSPDFEALRTRKGRGLIVTAGTDLPGFDFVSRYFAPWVGINEDPVTGSAHCILAPYWAAKLRKQYMTAVQVSARGGILHLRLSADRVYIGGMAATVSTDTIE